MDSNQIIPRVLCADDDSIARALLGSFFARLGWSAEIVSNGKIALDRLEHATFDVIVTDFMMPEVSGLDLLRAIRSKNPNQAVVVLTGAGTAQDLVEVLRSGASEIIQKPLHLDSLERAIRRALSTARQKEASGRVMCFVTHDHTEYEFNSAELSALKIPLVVADQLFAAGMISLHTKFKMELAFQEALTNSLEHGNLDLKSEWKESINDDGVDLYSVRKLERLKDPKYGDRKVRVGVLFDRAAVTITITDEGAGFHLPDSNQSSPGEASFGRGLGIIRATMDDVKYELGGRRIILIKRITQTTE